MNIKVTIQIYQIITNFNYTNIIVIMDLMKKGYKITPDATILERMVVAGVFGGFSYALSEAILSNEKLIKL